MDEPSLLDKRDTNIILYASVKKIKNVISGLKTRKYSKSFQVETNRVLTIQLDYNNKHIYSFSANYDTYFSFKDTKKNVMWNYTFYLHHRLKKILINGRKILFLIFLKIRYIN